MGGKWVRYLLSLSMHTTKGGAWVLSLWWYLFCVCVCVCWKISPPLIPHLSPSILSNICAIPLFVYLFSRLARSLLLCFQLTFCNWSHCGALAQEEPHRSCLHVLLWLPNKLSSWLRGKEEEFRLEWWKRRRWCTILKFLSPSCNKRCVNSGISKAPASGAACTGTGTNSKGSCCWWFPGPL